MKKTFLSIVALLTVGFASAQANSIKLNPLAFFGGTDLLSYEFKLSDSSTGIIGAGMSSFKIGDDKYSSTGGELQYRLYFDKALSRWYAGAQVGYASGNVKLVSSSETKFNSLKLGGKIGYQWLWDSGFTLDLNLGVAHNSFKYESNDSQFSALKASGVLPNLGFALGYSF